MSLLARVAAGLTELGEVVDFVVRVFFFLFLLACCHFIRGQTLLVGARRIFSQFRDALSRALHISCCYFQLSNDVRPHLGCHVKANDGWTWCCIFIDRRGAYRYLYFFDCFSHNYHD